MHSCILHDYTICLWSTHKIKPKAIQVFSVKPIRCTFTSGSWSTTPSSLPPHCYKKMLTNNLLKHYLDLPGSTTSEIYCANVLSTLLSTHTTLYLQQQNGRPLFDALFSEEVDFI